MSFPTDDVELTIILVVSDPDGQLLEISEARSGP